MCLCINCWHFSIWRTHNLQCSSQFWCIPLCNNLNTWFLIFLWGKTYLLCRMQTPSGFSDTPTTFWVVVVVVAVGYSSHCHPAGTLRLFAEWQEGKHCPFLHSSQSKWDRVRPGVPRPPCRAATFPTRGRLPVTSKEQSANERRGVASSHFKDSLRQSFNFPHTGSDRNTYHASKLLNIKSVLPFFFHLFFIH